MSTAARQCHDVKTETPAAASALICIILYKYSYVHVVYNLYILYAHRAYDRRRAEEHCPDGRSGGTFNILYYVLVCAYARARIQSDVYLFNNSNYDSIRLYCSPRVDVGSTLSDGHIDERRSVDSTTCGSPPRQLCRPFDRDPVTPTFPAPFSGCAPSS